MAINVSITEKNKLEIRMVNEQNFSSVVAILKKHKGEYKDRLWYFKPGQYESLYEELCDITQVNEPSDFKDKLQNSKVQSQIEKYRFPVIKSELKVQPFPGKPPYENYQYEDLISLMSTNRLALFLEMGLGKSWEFINTIDLLRRKKNVKKVVIVTSGSGVYNLFLEFQKFSNIPESEISIGDKDNRRPFDDISKNIILMNFRSFLLVSDEYRKDKDNSKEYRTCPLPLRKWLGDDPGIFVLDESHSIATPDSRQTKVIHLAKPYFKYRYLASGTPADVEWKYYSQLKFLDESLVHGLDFAKWSSEYFYPDKYSEYKPGEIKPEKAQKLQEIVKSVSIRRFAKDVLNLPDNFIDNYYVPFSNEHRYIYENIVRDTLTRIKEQSKNGLITTKQTVNMFQTLLLSIDDPELLLSHTDLFDVKTLDIIRKFKFEKEHSKIEALYDILNKRPESKTVIWTSHPLVGHKLGKYLSGYNPIILNGQTEIPKGYTKDSFKLHLVRKFEESLEHRVFIAGQQVLNTAVTMVKPNVQIYFDTDFNFNTKSQSERRIYRIGQTQNVYTYNIIIDESLDVVRAKNLEDKDFVNNNFLNKEYLDLQLAKMMFTMKGN